MLRISGKYTQTTLISYIFMCFLQGRNEDRITVLICWGTDTGALELSWEGLGLVLNARNSCWSSTISCKDIWLYAAYAFICCRYNGGQMSSSCSPDVWYDDDFFISFFSNTLARVILLRTYRVDRIWDFCSMLQFWICLWLQHLLCKIRQISFCLLHWVSQY